MPRNPYPGTKITNPCNDGSFFETRISFETLYNHPKLANLEKPCEQGALNDDKVKLMINEYETFPAFLRFKNRVVIGNLNDTWYIVDGQHRIEMAKQLYHDYAINDELIFCWYACDEQRMRQLFNSINHDSTKNQFYIQQSNLEQIRINEFTKFLQTHYKTSFATKKTLKGKIKTIEELRDELIKVRFFENNDSIQHLVDRLIEKNNTFYDIVRFKIDIAENTDNFYKEEIKHITQHIIFSLKSTNFTAWIADHNITPFHRNKRGKKRISKKMRDQCWVLEYGSNELVTCPISTCSLTMMKNTRDWNVGHIISEYNGGDTIMSNLRPICVKCNLDMGTMNWTEYDDL
jgi:hypothetical protein